MNNNISIKKHILFNLLTLLSLFYNFHYINCVYDNNKITNNDRLNVKLIKSYKKDVNVVSLLSIRSGFGGSSSFSVEEDESETDKNENSKSSNVIVVSGSPSYLKKLDGIYVQTGISIIIISDDSNIITVDYE